MSAESAGPGVRAARTTAVLAAAVVVAVEVALVAGWVVFLAHDEGWSRIVWLVVGLLVVWRLVPRPERLSSRARTVPPAEAPALHRLVEEVADRVGAPRPHRVAVDTTYPVMAYATGYLGRVTLVVGLPQWLALDAPARAAAVALELGCVRPRRGPAGCLVRLADDLLTSARTILVPTTASRADERAIDQTTSDWGEAGGGVAGGLVAARLGREVAEAAGGAGLSVVAAPLRVVQAGLRRSWRRVLAASALEADAAAASLAGPAAVAAVLATVAGVPVGLSAARSAARSHQGEDPFAAVRAARIGRPEVEQRLAACAGERTEPDHPTFGERVAAVRPLVVDPDRRVAPDLLEAADRELEAMQPGLVGQLTEELVHGRP